MIFYIILISLKTFYSKNHNLNNPFSSLKTTQHLLLDTSKLFLIILLFKMTHL